ncbi:gamma-glutamylcyclotransferase [Oceanobacillus damuensis]|uniref:gamma-glutamylcyclotransferase n=1 Tax=Oceanobacillus damuensis TaxID=937928 RepID=UPI00082BFD2C|nr:gamma-glutamylcyclotransferase family protein [Oceanobacillus damuensis]
MTKLFVYGTLRMQEENCSYLKNAKCLHDQTWIYGKLYDTNKGYPVMKENNVEKVYGELYEVSDEQLAAIDRLEGYREGGSDNLYERKLVAVFDDFGPVAEALTYITGRSLADSTDVIPFGDWKVYRYMRKGEIYYFAYGSCMDDRRFKLAKVDQYFSNIIGSGRLDGYGFRFSRSTKDGGKADLIVSPDEFVEGVIYRLPMEGVDYLYEREGVYVEAYRPLIETVSTVDGTDIDVLTFIGIAKSDETKPTEVYADEILTGAEKLLSGSYIEGLRKRIGHLMGGMDREKQT